MYFVKFSMLPRPLEEISAIISATLSLDIGSFFSGSSESAAASSSGIGSLASALSSTTFGSVAAA